MDGKTNGLSSGTKRVETHVYTISENYTSYENNDIYGIGFKLIADDSQHIDVLGNCNLTLNGYYVKYGLGSSLRKCYTIMYSNDSAQTILTGLGLDKLEDGTYTILIVGHSDYYVSSPLSYNSVVKSDNKFTCTYHYNDYGTILSGPGLTIDRYGDTSSPYKSIVLGCYKSP